MSGRRWPDGGSNIAEGIGERLQTVAVSGDGELALDEAPELRLKVDGARHLIIKKQIGDECPSFLRGLFLRHDYVEDFVRD